MAMASIGRNRFPAGERALSEAEMSGTQTTRLRSRSPEAAYVMITDCMLDINSPVIGAWIP